MKTLESINKEVKYAFGKKIYLLGIDKNGIKYWLEEPSWECDWYWGFGYIETYTNNKNPEKSRDIASHQHFSTLFFNTGKSAFDAFKDFFEKTPFSKDEIWTLIDYMMTFYKLKETAALFRHGYSWQTESAKLESLIDPDLCKRINNELIPEVLKNVKGLLANSD